MDYRPSRRSFLAVSGAGAAGTLAGCTSSDNQPQTDGGESANSETEATLTVQVQADQQKLTSLQEELQAEIEAGDTTRQEAQKELQNRQVALTKEAASAYEETASDNDAITVEDATPEYGILRVTAPAITFVNGLEDGTAAAILPSGYYDQYLQQQQVQDQMEQQAENQETNTSSE